MNSKLFNLLLQIIILLITFSLAAQTGPGGVGNVSSNEIWLPVEENTFLDAGTIRGTNGSVIQQWNDISGNSNNAIQTDNSFKPSLNTNALNGFSTLTFSGSDRILSAGVNSNSQATIFVVVQFNSLVNNNDGILQAGPAGTAFSTNVNDKSIGMWINRSNGRIWGRGIQSNNATLNLPQNTALATGQFYIITQDFDGLDITQYVDGAAVGSVSYDNTLKDWSDFGIGRQGAESLHGDLAELVVHRVSLNSAQRVITQNYLAAKYGLTLAANDIYDQDDAENGNYDHDVAGIGRIDALNIHDDAQGTGIVRILNPSGLGDDEFLIWGHDDTEQQAVDTTDVPAGVQARFKRVWRVSEVKLNSSNANVGRIDMRWDLNGLGLVTASDLRLLIDTDNDGLFNDETAIDGAVDLGDGIYEFQRVPGGGNGISNDRRFTLGTINPPQTPLPIELLYFNAKNIDDRYVKLEWQTATENNNDFFTIERSEDGINWTSVRTINGAGYSNSSLDYESFDYQPSTGSSYYRLKQTDYDGRYSYSQIKRIRMNLKTDNILIWPNPSDGIVTIQQTKLNTSDLKIYNALGQELTKRIIVLSKTENQITLDLRKFNSGVYYIKHHTTSRIFYKR